MNEKITWQQFMLRQPNYPQEKPTDQFYFRLANRLVEEAQTSGVMASWPESTVCRVVLTLIGYYQGVIADAGAWRSFVNEHYRLYGRRLPFYDSSEESGYVLYELNEADVRFLVWYASVMYTEDRRVTSPYDEELGRAARFWFEILDREYDEAPLPEDYNISRGLEIHNPEEAEQVWHLGQWLFLHCYLMTPAFSLTLTEIMSDPAIAGSDDVTLIQNRLEESMSAEPTGPLALYIREWLYLMLEDRMPPAPRVEALAPERPESRYYSDFTAYTGGETIRFFGSYEELNRFFIDALHWSADEKHLYHLHECRDFVLMVNPEKGMLLAHDICRCISYPSNPYYDREYARHHAIDLLTVRGVCPADLLHFLFGHNALPDACFPGTDDTALVAENADFIARLYLQKYYRGD